MELENLFQRLKQSVCSIRWNTQTIAILILACVALVGVIIVQQQPAEPSARDPLFADRTLTAFQLARIEAALGKEDLTNYVVERGSLCVPIHERARYLAAIQEANCLPQSSHSPTQDALDAHSILDTSRQRTQRMHTAREQEARLAIRKLPGVEDAFVFFDEKTDRSIRARQRTTAVVGVHTSSVQPLDLRGFRIIQDMLLGFKAGLEVEGITITDLTAGQSIRGLIDLGSPQTQSIVRQRLALEWKKKLVGALSFVPEADVDVRIALSKDCSEAQSVNVSVDVPTSYPNRAADLSLNDRRIRQRSEEETRDKIRSKIQPLLPPSQVDARPMIAVNFHDVRESPIPSKSTWPTVITPTITSGLFVVLLAVGVAIFVFGVWDRGPDTQQHLRVYGADEPVNQDHHDGENHSAVELRAYVEEDPDGVAKSLSEFIDRAS